MFVYLSKKIAIPHGVNLRCISWNREDGYIACGGDPLPRNDLGGGGEEDQNFALLKVIRLDGPGAGGAASGSLSMNQTLDGHRDAVVVAAWNETSKKLTTSDRTGLIIVWMLYNGAWVEEMINNRKASVVTDMRWTADGTKICIAYEDGAVIVGSVDGSRLWGKELGIKLALVEWSPDGRLICFASPGGSVHLYDQGGEHVSKLPLPCTQGVGMAFEIAGIDWYPGTKGHPEPGCATLCVAIDAGRFQLMRDETDDTPVVVDTGMTLNQVKWCPDGTILAVSGHLQGGQLAVQFYSHRAQHLQTLRVPGTTCSGISWDGSGTRLAIAVDSNIYFAGVRPKYLWCCLGSTVVYGFGRPDRPEHCVMFWDTKLNEKHLKYVRALLALEGSGEHCALVSRNQDDTSSFTVTLCNAIGSPVEARSLPVEPHHTAMTPTHFAMASKDVVYVWRYGDAISKDSVDLPGRLRALTLDGPSAGSALVECVWGIDDPPPSEPRPLSTFVPPILVTSYPITCIAINRTHLVVARSSGIAQLFRLLPSGGVQAEGEVILRPNPAKVGINCDSTRLFVISNQAVLTMADVAPRTGGEGSDGTLRRMASQSASGNTGGGETDALSLQAFDRRDVWDCRWAEDNPNLMVVCEKNKQWVYRGLEPEEPQTSLSYVWAFSDLEVRCVDLDLIYRDPENPEPRAVAALEMGTLKECRQLLQGKQAKEAVALAMRMSHPRLWQLVAEHSLLELDFKTADLAFVKCGDFAGVQFIKHVKTLEGDRLRQAEIAVFLKRYDAAEEFYHAMDRMDLAVEMRMKIGEWFRVEKMVESGLGDDATLQLTRNRIGDYYAERQQWKNAAIYYTHARNAERLAECFVMLEDYESLARLIPTVPDGSPLLRDLAEMFLAVGMCDEAVQSYQKSGDVAQAVNACVLLQRWDRALILAQEHGLEQVGTLVDKYAAHLTSKGNRFECVELYRKAGRHQDAVRLLMEMARESADQKGKPVRVKQLYLLAALEYERFQRAALGQSDAALTQQLTGRGPGAPGTSAGAGATRATAARQTLAGLMTLDAVAADSKEMTSPWRYVQAFHFWLLAHRQLYGGTVDALRTALHLRAYEDVLGAREVYSFLALAAFYSQYLRWCSKAFIKLESLRTLDPESQERLSDLAVSIFAAQPPTDKSDLRAEDLMRANVREEMCVATGRLLKGLEAVRCKVCKHQTLRTEAKTRAHCPLCHSPFALSGTDAGLGMGSLGGPRASGRAPTLQGTGSVRR